MRRTIAGIATLALATACGGGGGGGGDGSPSSFLGGSGMPGVVNLQVCDGACAQQSLSQAQVMTIITQGVNEAQANGVAATIAVTDRVGNPLAVYRMNGAETVLNITSRKGLMFPGNGLEEVGSRSMALNPAGVDVITTDFAAISKAGTASFLSSQGNAFSTRTANFIIQEHFSPGELMKAGGPLFGVQFTQLACGDVVRKAPFIEPDHMMAGPKRLPIGFSADGGSGMPLYINGVPVGGVGVEVDGIYTLDINTLDRASNSPEERIAFAAQKNFEHPPDRESEFITVDGKTLRFGEDRRTLTSPLTELATDLPPMSVGTLVDDGAATGGITLDIATNRIVGETPTPGFYRAMDGVLAGTQLLDPASGYASAGPTGYAGTGVAAEILVNPDGTPYLGNVDLDAGSNFVPTGAVTNPRDSIVPTPANGGLTMAEVRLVIREALRTANRSRAQIRRPQGSSVRVNITVVDLHGNLIGFARTPDPPNFGTDTSIQKARTAAYFSRGPGVAGLALTPGEELIADVELADPLDGMAGIGAAVQFQSKPIGDYIDDADASDGEIGLRQFLDPSQPDLPEGVRDLPALSNGVAFSDRSGGNLSRPLYPDGIDGNPPGPFSHRIDRWSIFNTGLQLDLILDRLLQGLLVDPTQNVCTSEALGEVRGGIQIFPGSVPLFKNGMLAGGIGISGDGVDQDDLMAFFGAFMGGQAIANELGGNVGNAPMAIRSDRVRKTLSNRDRTFLRYVQCPTTPFNDDNQQNICEGK